VGRGGHFDEPLGEKCNWQWSEDDDDDYYYYYIGAVFC
jgi:hypothetical protein